MFEENERFKGGRHFLVTFCCFVYNIMFECTKDTFSPEYFNGKHIKISIFVFFWLKKNLRNFCDHEIFSI